MTDKPAPSEMEDDVKVLHSMGYAQELARRMSGFSNFAISFWIICILAGGITSFPAALTAGGPFSVTIGWLVGGVFALVVAASLGEIASAYPTAGGLYHWSSILGGRGWGWATAWTNLVGLIFVVASVNVGVYGLFRDLIVAGIFGVDVSGWGYGQQLGAVLIISATQGVLNHFGIRVTTLLTDFSGYLIFVVAVALTATMAFFGAGHPENLFTFTNYTGAAGGGYYPDARWPVVAFLMGLLYPIYTITGFDASAHTAEETKDAQRAVPRGMLHSVIWSLIFGFAMAMAFIYAIPDVAAAAKDGGNAWLNLFAALPAPAALKIALAIGVVVANYLCALACVTSTSRMIYAFARDGGLPFSGILKNVHHHHRTPVAAIWTTVVVSFAATLYTPAFSALSAGCALFLYVSYAMPVLAGTITRGRTWTTFGPFQLGKWSEVFGLITVVGVIVLIFAGLQPPNDIVVTYGIGFVVLLAALWFGLERWRFQGPPIGSTISDRAGDISAAEAELAAEDAVPAE
jgi:amino acid transporter